MNKKTRTMLSKMQSELETIKSDLKESIDYILALEYKDVKAQMPSELEMHAIKIDKMQQDVASMANDLEMLADEEDEKYDNMPESLQDSERGEAMYEAAENLHDASAELDGMFDDPYEPVAEKTNITCKKEFDALMQCISDIDLDCIDTTIDYIDDACV